MSLRTTFREWLGLGPAAVKTPVRLGLALGGGGVRGAAHLGVPAVEEVSLRISARRSRCAASTALETQAVSGTPLEFSARLAWWTASGILIPRSSSTGMPRVSSTPSVHRSGT